VPKYIRRRKDSKITRTGAHGAPDSEWLWTADPVKATLHALKIARQCSEEGKPDTLIHWEDTNQGNIIRTATAAQWLEAAREVYNNIFPDKED
jgi:hypothetical protein